MTDREKIILQGFASEMEKDAALGQTALDIVNTVKNQAKAFASGAKGSKMKITKGNPMSKADEATQQMGHNLRRMGQRLSIGGQRAATRGARKARASLYKTKKKTQSLFSGGGNTASKADDTVNLNAIENPSLGSGSGAATKNRPMQGPLYAGNKAKGNMSRGSKAKNSGSQAKNKAEENMKGSEKTKQLLKGVVGGSVIGGGAGYGISQMTE